MWLDETQRAARPRNIYGVTKRAAEELCRLTHDEHGLPVVVLRTARFFPEDDDTHRDAVGREHEGQRVPQPPADGAGLRRARISRRWSRRRGSASARYIVSAPTPFARDDAAALKADAAAVIARHFPDARRRSTRRAAGRCPASIGRVYDASAIERDLGFRCATDFAAILDALRARRAAAVRRTTPSYVSPQLNIAAG